MPSIESYELLLRAVRACEDKKAEDIRILALDPTESGLSDYFVICNGTNTRQNVAITDEVELQLKHEYGVYPNSVEGRREGDWILMDYVDFILHVFTPEKREFYGLERLRKSATTVSPDELSAELKAKVKELKSKETARPKREQVEPAAGDETPATRRAVAKKVAAAVKKAPAAEAETKTPRKSVSKAAAKVPTKKAATKTAAKPPAKAATKTAARATAKKAPKKSAS